MIELRRRKDVRALAVLDMDGTLLESRSIDVLCQRSGLETKLGEIDRRSELLESYEVSESIAQLFAGMRASDLEMAFDSIEVVSGAKEFIGLLRKSKFLTAIVTDSYTFLASRLAEKLVVDVVWGNKLEMLDGVITGRIVMPLGWEKQKNCQKKAVCKLHAMYKLAQKYEIGMGNTLAVGDSKSDFCIVEGAALGVAFRPKDPEIAEIADLAVYKDFFELVEKLKPFLDRFQ